MNTIEESRSNVRKNLDPSYLTVYEARKIILGAVKEYSIDKEYHFPAIQKDVKLDEGRIAIDLGYQKDPFKFFHDLDKTMLGDSRIELKEQAEYREGKISGFNTVYPFYLSEKSRVLVHVWFYSTCGRADFDWHIRGHEEGHIINTAVGDLSKLSSEVKIFLERFNEESLPEFLASYALESRGISLDKLDRERKNWQINSSICFKSLYSIEGETRLEQTIIKSAVFFQGARETRKRDCLPIGNHINEVLEFIDKQKYDKDTRSKLRVIALLHDLGKQVTNHLPRGHTSKLPHGMISAIMAKDFFLDPELVDIISYHDDHFYMYKEFKGEQVTKKKLKRSKYYRHFLDIDLDLMLKFNYADSANRNIDAVKWFEWACKKIGFCI